MIAPTSALPAVQSGVTIDGYSQPGAAENTSSDGDTNATILIQLSGANFESEPPPGLRLTGSGSTIRGLAIGGGFLYGISVTGSGNVVRGNFVGTDAAGTAARTNAIYGAAGSSSSSSTARRRW
jgi:trimeric autotransporter adhesin